jgi:tetratricopeptide (TPR) repeat protein
VCEAYTASTPYAVWRELLREFMGFGRDDPDDVVVERLRAELAIHAPDLAPWLPLIGIPFGIDVPPTPEVEMLAESNRRMKLHEVVGRLLVAIMPDAQLIEIEDAHHMDGASAELLSYLTGEIGGRPWLIGIARRSTASGFTAPELPTVTRMELKPLAPADAIKMIRRATEEHPQHMHVVEVIAQRSGGNPQFLRDLVRSVIASGGIGGLPDSAEAAATALIDSLAPNDRAVVRRAAVFGQAFHPRMLSWLAEEGDDALPGSDVWKRLQAFFSEEADGYLRFRRSLLRDAAYEGLPYKLRRQLHGRVAARIAQEADDVDEVAGILSLHYLIAGEDQPAWRYATVAGKRAAGVNAYVEAARLFTRALEAGRRLVDVGPRELAPVHRALGDAWYRASEYEKASDAYLAAREVTANDPLADASLLLDLSRVEAKLGQCEKSLRWAEQARAALHGIGGNAAARQMARLGAWYAMVLQTEGRTVEAQEWAQRTVAEAESADEPEALGDAYYVLGCAYGEQGKEESVSFMERSQEAHLRSGNRARQADVLTNLGLVYQWAGRWDEALTHYERGRIESQKIGDTVGAGLARVNIAEILIDRGEWAEAEAQLVETLPLWKASRYRYYLGACLLFLGRTSLCLGRVDEAVDHLEQAKANFLHFGAEEQVPLAEARIAECRVASGNTDAALKIVRDMLGRASSSVGVGRVVSLIERVQAHALVLKGDLRGARDALNASLTAARGRKDLFESTLTMLSLIALDRHEGIEPPLEMVDESRSLLASLKVRAAPPIPLGAA